MANASLLAPALPRARRFQHLLLDLVVGVLQLGCGSGLLRIIKPTVPYEVQYDCMLRVSREKDVFH
jgi:hypothetical protein